MVSMQSYYDSPTSPQQPDPYVGASHTAYTPPTSWIGGHQSQGYEPVPTATPLSLSRSGSSRTRRGCYSLAFSGEHEAILPTAAPMGQDQSYEAVPAHDAADDVPFDPTSTLGPPSLQDDSFVKKLQEAEAKGHLTGGLGAGGRLEARGAVPRIGAGEGTLEPAEVHHAQVHPPPVAAGLVESKCFWLSMLISISRFQSYRRCIGKY